jgi:hypothetical protein
MVLRLLPVRPIGPQVADSHREQQRKEAPQFPLCQRRLARRQRGIGPRQDALNRRLREHDSPMVQGGPRVASAPVRPEERRRVVGAATAVLDPLWLRPLKAVCVQQLRAAKLRLVHRGPASSSVSDSAELATLGSGSGQESATDPASSGSPTGSASCTTAAAAAARGRSLSSSKAKALPPSNEVAPSAHDTRFFLRSCPATTPWTMVDLQSAPPWARALASPSP